MISVCMATYNGAKYIEEQIDSILPQLSENDELIISDDGSTDGTLDIINSYSDKRIKLYRFIRNKHNKHPSILIGENFQNALNMSKGDYIFISDQDDIWASSKISIFKDLLQKYDLVTSNGFEFFPDGTGSSIYNYNNPFKNLFLLKRGYYGCCLGFRRTMLKYILPFPNNLPNYDHWIGFICELNGKVFYYDKILIQHRLHYDNAGLSTKFSISYKIRYRLMFFYRILYRTIKMKFKYKIEKQRL